MLDRIYLTDINKNARLKMTFSISIEINQFREIKTQGQRERRRENARTFCMRKRVSRWRGVLN